MILFEHQSLAIHAVIQRGSPVYPIGPKCQQETRILRMPRNRERGMR